MVIWSEPAKTDLRSIHDFIAHDSRHYAKKVRELSLYSYRIIYKITDQSVFVLAVVHKRKDFKVGDIER